MHFTLRRTLKIVSAETRHETETGKPTIQLLENSDCVMINVLKIYTRWKNSDIRLRYKTCITLELDGEEINGIRVLIEFRKTE